MKTKLIFITFLLITSCATQETRDDSDTVDLENFIEVRELNENSYVITFAGSPENTLEQARNAWHKKAREVCEAAEYNHTFTKNLMWQGELEVSDIGAHEGGMAGATGAACATGGAIGCMTASLFQGFSSGGDIPKFPVVEGNLNCSENLTE